METSEIEFKVSLRSMFWIWSTRGALMFSLLLQSFLTLMAPFRMSTRARPLFLLIWSAYLIADATSKYVLGLINKSISGCSGGSENLYVLWAPILLLHLGCPDTITAFSLMDNDLWLRHLLTLILHAATVGYIFWQSLNSSYIITQWFQLVPAILMFIAGVIKYSERIYAMYLANFDRFWNSKLKEPDPAASIEEKEGPLNDLEMVYYAHQYFKIFKGIEVRKFFYHRSAEDALRLLEVELNFMHETLYTKVNIMNTITGYVFRIVAFGSILATLGLFHFSDKSGRYWILNIAIPYGPLDIAITYILLIGAIILEVIGFLMLIFSDQTFASCKDPNRPRCWLVAAVFRFFLYLKRPRWYPCKCEIKHHVLATPLALRRWSESVSAHNLIRFCLKSSCKTIHEFPSFGIKKCIKKTITKINQFPIFQWIASFRYYIKGQITSSLFFRKINSKIFKAIPLPIQDLLDKLMYVSHEPFTRELWEFIFHELQIKSKFAADTPDSEIATARVDWVLTHTDSISHLDPKRLLEYVSDVQYDESLLSWHIATDLCYYSDEEKVNAKQLSHRQFSKILSDYMLYLLIFQPKMMPTVARTSKTRFQDTCAVAKSFLKTRYLGPNKDSKACKEILSAEPATSLEGDKSTKSVLYKASMLAKELEQEGEDKWKLMSRVWVELLSYAATHCKPEEHAEQVSKGGQLITFVWLLMAHLSLGRA